MSAMSGATGSPPVRTSRDDRVYPLVRVVAVLVVVVLVLAVLALYFFPDQTDVNFAWTIRPRISAMVIGAGYLMGIVYFSRVATSARWHRVSGGFLPITAFCVAMVLATLVHLDRFHGGSLQFWMWVIIYAVTPFLVPGLWWWNHREDNGAPEPNDAVMPRALRTVAAVAGACVGLAGLAIFAMPDLVISLWPWTLTPLLARVYAGWMMLPAVGGLSLARESRWSVWRVMLESVMPGIAASLLAMLLVWSDFDQSKITTWLFAAVLIGALIGGGVLFFNMERRRAAAPGNRLP